MFAGFNALLTGYAIVAFMGLRNSIVDVVLGMVQDLGAGAREGPEEGRSRDGGDRPGHREAGTPSSTSVPDATGVRSNGRKIAVTQAPPPRRGDTRAHERS